MRRPSWVTGNPTKADRDFVADSTHPVRDMVAIGASAGGVPVLRELLSRLTPGFPGTLFIVVHRSPFHRSHLAEVIRGRTRHAVTEPRDGEKIEHGHVYLAPRDLHLLIGNGAMRLQRGPKEHFTRPAVDPLFRSLATAYRARVVGIVLSGGGYDGGAGLQAIKAAGGIALVQRPEDSTAPSMPRYAIAADRIDGVLNVRELATAIGALMRGQAWSTTRTAS